MLILKIAAGILLACFVLWLIPLIIDAASARPLSAAPTNCTSCKSHYPADAPIH